MCNLNLKDFTAQVCDEEYQQKRKRGLFQSYDINIYSYPHFRKEGEIQGMQIGKRDDYKKNSYFATLKFEVSK